jgi:SAM-dependent methyltransferase
MCELVVGSDGSAHPTTGQAGYWDELAAAWLADAPHRLWRDHSDAVNSSLLAAWLPHRVDRLLKTDLFDEAVAEGLHPLLASRARLVVAIDLSAEIVRAATERHPSLHAITADVRCLPFPDGVFDVIVSTSTLDHFSSRRELVTALRELRRVLRPGGELLLTLDNPANPIVALRARLPFPLLRRLGLLPYFVGATCGPNELVGVLAREGFDVLETTAVLHCPRVVAVAVARLVERHARPRVRRRFLRGLMAWERLQHWPTRFRSGHFVAARAVRC